MQRTITTPPITEKQKEILSYLLKFRYLHTHQLQILLNHKNTTRIHKWLQDLINKGCVAREYDRMSIERNSKPAIFYLAPKSRHILSSEKHINLSDLEYIYKEHRRDKKFINHCIAIADIYLFLLAQKDASEEVKFFTKHELKSYEYFPNPLPDAFIAVVNRDTTRRYFLDMFDEYTPSFVARQRVRYYFEYIEKNDWDDNTNYTKFPAILFVFEKESLLRHIKIYGKTQFDKTYENGLSLYVTTKTMITYGEKNSIWDKVE